MLKADYQREIKYFDSTQDINFTVPELKTILTNLQNGGEATFKDTEGAVHKMFEPADMFGTTGFSMTSLVDEQHAPGINLEMYSKQFQGIVTELRSLPNSDDGRDRAKTMASRAYDNRKSWAPGEWKFWSIEYNSAKIKLGLNITPAIAEWLENYRKHINAITSQEIVGQARSWLFNCDTNALYGIRKGSDGYKKAWDIINAKTAELQNQFAPPAGSYAL